VPIAAILVFYSITSSRRLIHHFIPFALWYGRKRAKVDPGSGGFSDRVECCDAFNAESRTRAACLFVGHKRFGSRRHSCSKKTAPDQHRRPRSGKLEVAAVSTASATVT